MHKLLLLLLCLPLIGFGQNLSIGETYQGGIIFYLDGSGGGLIAAPSDQSSSAEWGCYGVDLLDANGTAIGTGAQNTIDIETGCLTLETAADFCTNLNLNGYEGWFLPSKDELNAMYLNIGQGNILGLGNIGNFADENYWSSSEFNTDYSWIQYFHYGSQNTNNKNGNYNVRAIRDFSNISNINDHRISIENKNLIKIVDIFGRESNIKNHPLFYIYDDGTVEKRIVIE
jgi:hypothetical protein